MLAPVPWLKNIPPLLGAVHTEKPYLPQSNMPHLQVRSMQTRCVASPVLERSEHDPGLVREEERRQVVGAAAVARLPAQHRARRRVPHLGTI